MKEKRNEEKWMKQEWNQNRNGKKTNVEKKMKIGTSKKEKKILEQKIRRSNANEKTQKDGKVKSRREKRMEEGGDEGKEGRKWRIIRRRRRERNMWNDKE